MRFTALATVICFLVGFTQASADDFSALLAELSFGARPAAASAAPNLGVAPNRVAGVLRPAPNSFDLPGLPQASLQGPVARGQASSSASKLNLGAASALQEMNRQSGNVSANSVGHLFSRGRGHSGDCDTCDAPRIAKRPCATGCGEILDAPGQCQSCAPGSCFGKHKEEVPSVCVPRQEVRLPSSTMYQYFRSNRCHTNVWAGYSQECGKNHQCLHGTCDCHSKKKPSCQGGCEVLPPRSACNDCKSCDGPCGH